VGTGQYVSGTGVDFKVAKRIVPSVTINAGDTQQALFAWNNFYDRYAIDQVYATIDGIGPTLNVPTLAGNPIQLLRGSYKADAEIYP
jgi:hypothetical protein